jgi:hypothetical protein
MIRKYEREIAIPSVDAAKKIANAFGGGLSGSLQFFVEHLFCFDFLAQTKAKN